MANRYELSMLQFHETTLKQDGVPARLARLRSR